MPTMSDDSTKLAFNWTLHGRGRLRLLPCEHDVFVAMMPSFVCGESAVTVPSECPNCGARVERAMALMATDDH